MQGGLPGVGNGASADRMFAHFFDLVAGFEEKRSAFGGPLVKIRELLAIFALGHHGRPFALTRRKSAEAIIGKRKPIAALGVLAFVDNVQADLALALDQMAYGGFSGEAFWRG